MYFISSNQSGFVENLNIYQQSNVFTGCKVLCEMKDMQHRLYSAVYCWNSNMMWQVLYRVSYSCIAKN